MAKKKDDYKGYDISTRAVHTGNGYDEGTGAVRRPLHMANSYKLPDDLSQVNYSSTDLLIYARNGNPNQHWLEEKIASMHDADDCIVLGSGVAALHALFWTLFESGDHVVYPNVSYMAVYRLLHELFNNKFKVYIHPKRVFLILIKLMLIQILKMIQKIKIQILLMGIFPLIICIVLPLILKI